MESHKRLRSAVWSSETLMAGMKSVQLQFDQSMVKCEQDEELLREYEVSCFKATLGGYISYLVFLVHIKLPQ